MEAKQSSSSNTENQLIVPCPKWLRRAMVKSLLATANSKISPKRAKTASRILAAIG